MGAILDKISALPTFQLVLVGIIAISALLSITFMLLFFIEIGSHGKKKDKVKKEKKRKKTSQNLFRKKMKMT